MTPPTTTGVGAGVGGEQPKASSTTFVDIDAGVGYSSNPLLQLQGRSSAFARISLVAAFIAGIANWEARRCRGIVENTTYLRGGYGSKQIFSLSARTRRAVSEKVSVFGDLAFSGDIAGQLSNRFVTPAPDGTPPPPDTNPPPGTNPELFNFSGRQYRLIGTVGASIATGARSSVSLSAGATHGFFTGSNKAADYSTYQGKLRLQSPAFRTHLGRRERERLAGGLRRKRLRERRQYERDSPHAAWAEHQRQRVDRDSGHLRAIAPGVNSHSYSPSFSGSICATGERSSLCANISRDASVAARDSRQTQGSSGASINTNLGVNYSRSLGPRRNDPGVANGDAGLHRWPHSEYEIHQHLCDGTGRLRPQGRQPACSLAYRPARESCSKTGQTRAWTSTAIALPALSARRPAMMEAQEFERSDAGFGWMINHLPTILWQRRWYVFGLFAALRSPPSSPHFRFRRCIDPRRPC